MQPGHFLIHTEACLSQASALSALKSSLDLLNIWFLHIAITQMHYLIVNVIWESE